MEIRLPQLAEGADSGTVVNILIAVGSRVQKDQTVLELENQKAVAPIPSPAAGTVTQIHVKQGEVVSVGQLLVTVAEGDAPAAVATEQPAASPQGEYRYSSATGFPPPASPSIRKMAEELGIDLTHVRGSGSGGRITLEDVRAHIGHLQTGGGAKVSPKVDFSKWGSVTRKPFSATRQAIARAMQDSWSTIPHVTQFDEADVSSILDLLKKFSPVYERKGTRLTMTVFVIKALVSLLKRYPIFNSSLDESAHEIVYKQYVHLGIAVDTEAGLIVPVLKDADKKGMLLLSKELQELAEKTRSRKASAEDLQGGSFTLSNQGGIGGLHFTPIIHKPEVAILGLGQARRGMIPLALSYDHRVIDGADAARFIRDLVQALENFPESEVER